MCCGNVSRSAEERSYGAVVDEKSVQGQMLLLTLHFEFGLLILSSPSMLYSMFSYDDHEVAALSLDNVRPKAARSVDIANVSS